MKIRIKNLRLRTIIGANEWERKVLQDVIINVKIELEGEAAVKSDNLEDTIDYKKLSKEIINMAEDSHFQLLESLAKRILDLIMKDDRVQNVFVEVDKPHALRFADSVSLSCSAERN